MEDRPLGRADHGSARTSLEPVMPADRKRHRVEQGFEIRCRAAAEDRDPAPDTIVEQGEQVAKLAGYLDRVGSRRDVDEGAVEVEEEAGASQQ